MKKGKAQVKKPAVDKPKAKNARTPKPAKLAHRPKSQ
jgi:hypothetical protein